MANQANARNGYQPRTPELDEEIARLIVEGKSVTFIMRNLITNVKIIYAVMRERGLVSKGQQAKLDAKQKKRDQKELSIELSARAADRQAQKIARMDEEHVNAAVRDRVLLNQIERRGRLDELRKTRKREYSKRWRQLQKEKATPALSPSLNHMRLDDAAGL